MSTSAEEVVDAISAISGTHPGHRAAHAKGTLLTGTFTPNGSGLTKAAHMQDTPSRVTVRFSNGGGDPNIPDYAHEGRGMAVMSQLSLKDAPASVTVADLGPAPRPAWSATPPRRSWPVRPPSAS